MHFELLYQPSFAVARLLLEPGDGIRAESGAMVGMSPTITMESRAAGGVGKALGRLLGGESFFQTTFTATHGPGELLLAAASIGDILPLHLNAEGYMVTSGCYLAGETGLQIETKASARSFLAGEGLFIMRVSGSGHLFLSSFGAIHGVNLMAGQPYVVDTGHIVAFTDTMHYEVRSASRSLFGSWKSGEGFVAQFTGPGTVYLQTRSPQGFGPWIGRFVPGKAG
jgi:uncharacterized protein (TIGR00266 family)